MDFAHLFNYSMFKTNRKKVLSYIEKKFAIFIKKAILEKSGFCQ